jgi:hypothetical protein
MACADDVGVTDSGVEEQSVPPDARPFRAVGRGRGQRGADHRVVANSIVGDVAAGTANAIVRRIRGFRGRRHTG